MILSGRWVYKRYKKRQANKEALLESAHTKHGDLILATQDEIFKTAVEDLGTSTEQQSDRPPSYSRIEQASLVSPQRTLHPSSSAESATPSPRWPLSDLSEPRETPLSSISRTQQSPPTQSYPSSGTDPLSPPSSRLAADQPAEIPVHGKWVWVPDENRLPDTAELQSIPHAIVDDSAAAELHAGGSLAELPSTPRTTSISEEDHGGSFVMAELDGMQLAPDDLET